MSIASDRRKHAKHLEYLDKRERLRLFDKLPRKPASYYQKPEHIEVDQKMIDAFPITRLKPKHQKLSKKG